VPLGLIRAVAVQRCSAPDALDMLVILPEIVILTVISDTPDIWNLVLGVHDIKNASIDVCVLGITDG